MATCVTSVGPTWKTNAACVESRWSYMNVLGAVCVKRTWLSYSVSSSMFIKQTEPV